MKTTTESLFEGVCVPVLRWVLIAFFVPLAFGAGCDVKTIARVKHAVKEARGE